FSLLLISNELRGGVECDAGIALDIDDASDLDSGSCLQRFAIAAQPLTHIAVARDGEHRHVALSVEFFCQALTADQPGLVIVRADEEKALSGWRIGVDRDYGDARGNGTINVIFHQGRIDYGDQNSGGLFL